MDGLRTACSAAVIFLLTGCGGTIPDCSDSEVKSRALAEAKAHKMNELLREKVSSPGFRMVTEIGGNDENTPSDIASQIANGDFEFEAWRKHRGSHEWIAVVVKQVETEWETQFSDAASDELGSIRTLDSGGNNSPTNCSAEWLGSKQSLPITFTVSRSSDDKELNVAVTEF